MATDHNFRIKNGLHVQGGTATFHSVNNNSDLVVGGVINTHDSGSPARITTSSTGQLYLDSTSGQDLYLGWWNTGNANIITEMKLRAPALYDRNNTSYYVNPATNSVLNDIDMRGANTKLPGHAYSNTHDNTNTYWHIGLGNESTNHVLNLRVFNSSNSYVNHRFMATGADIVGNLNVTGNLTVTGNIDRNSVTDLDVVDKTITLGVGQTEANSGDSGIIIDGSAASMLWSETNDRFEFNKTIRSSSNLNAAGYLLGTIVYNSSDYRTLNTGGSGWDTVIARNGGSPYADMKHSYRMNGTTVIDSSRNLSNIGTITSTSAGTILDSSQNLTNINNVYASGYRIGSTTVIDSSRNISANTSVTVGNSSTAGTLRAHYSDGSSMALEGYGLVMNRGASYIRPTTDNDKTLYIGGADASLDWLQIHFKTGTGLYMNGTRFMDSGRNLENIGSITANQPLILNSTVASNDTGDFKIIQSLSAAGGVGYAASVLGVNIDTAVNSNNLPTQDNVWGGVTGSAALVMSADISDNLNSFRFMTTPQNSSAGTALSTIATMDFEGGFTANGYIRSDVGYRISGTTIIDSSRNLTNIGTISSGAITARADTDALFIKSVTNQNAAEIAFSSQGPSTYAQIGRISYQHGDTQAYGGTDVFTIGTTETAPRILADGLLMFKSGLALKPASGTGAGTTLITSSRALQNITTISSGATTISSSTSMLLTLNPTANNYGGILYQYGGATKGSSIYNSGMMVYGGEANVSTTLQAGGQYGLFIHHSTRNVGIGTGTSAPGQKLTVAGGHIKLDEGYSLQWSDSFERIEQSDGHLEFFVNNGEAMTLDTNGLGIGTTSPSQKLHVVGKAYATQGFTTDGLAKSYTWRAIDNSSNSGVRYVKICRITAYQSARVSIELNGRSTSYGDNNFPAHGRLVGQLNNDDNYDFTYYNYFTGSSEVVTEIGQVDIDTTSTDIYVKISSFAEIAAVGVISDGDIYPTTGNTGASQGVASAPTGYTAITSQKIIMENTSGNVGIGEITPQTKLHVKTGDSGGTVYNTTYNGLVLESSTHGGLQILTPNNRNGLIYFGDNNNAVSGRIEYEHTNDAMLFVTAGSERLRINSSGSALFNSGGTALIASLNSSHSNGGYLRWTKSDVAEFFIGTSGTVGGGTAGYYDIYAIAGIGQRFFAGAAERMRINSAGNVGIGTTGPDYRLTVNGGGAASAKFQTNSSSVLIGEYSSGAVIWMDGSNGDFSGGDYFGLHALGTTDLSFSYAGSVKMTVKNTGKVGIGTGAPQGMLHIAESKASGGDLWTQIGAGNAPSIHIQNTGNAANTNAVLYFRNSSAEKASIGARFVNQSTGQSELRFSVTNSSGATRERMTLSGDGTLCIGESIVPNSDASMEIKTAAPNTGVTTLRLTNAVNNKGQRIDFYDDNAARAFTLSHDNGSNFAYMGTLVNEPFTFYTNSAERMRITSTGNVGIGTTAPASLLHVKGTQSYGSIRVSPTSANGESAMAFFLDTAGTQTSNAWVVGHAGWGNTNDFVIGNQAFGGPVMLMQQDGKVGIGTSSPAATLHLKASYPTLTLETSANANDPLITLKSSGGISGEGAQIYYDNSVGSLHITTTYANTAAAIKFHTATGADRATNNVRMIIDGDGLVGIGTTSPTQVLHVQGNARINQPDLGGAPAMTALLEMYGYEGRGVGIKMRDNVNSASGANNREWFVGTGYGQSGFNIGYSSTGSQSSYATQNKLNIDTAGNVTAAGAIASSGKLHVTGGNSGDILAEIGSVTQSQYVDLMLKSNSGTGELFKAGTSYTSWGGASALNIYNSNEKIAFHPSSVANVLQIDSTGLNVGASKNIRLNGVAVLDSSRNLVNIGTITTTGNIGVGIAASTDTFHPLKISDSGHNYVWIQSTTGTNEAMTRYSNPTSNNWYTGIRNGTSNNISNTGYHVFSSAFGATTGGWNASGQFFTANEGYALGSFRAPIFYDSANTSYYADPASTSLMNGIQLAGSLLLTAEGATNIKTRFIMGKASGSTSSGALYLNYGQNHSVYIGANATAALSVTGAITAGAAVNCNNVNATSSISTGYGLSLTNGSTNYLLYSNTGSEPLYLRDITNGQMITTWYTTRFQADKDFRVLGNTTLDQNVYIPDAKDLNIGTGSGGYGDILIMHDPDSSRGIGGSNTTGTNYFMYDTSNTIHIFDGNELHFTNGDPSPFFGYGNLMHSGMTNAFYAAYNKVVKFSTTNTGIQVTGKVVASAGVTIKNSTGSDTEMYATGTGTSTLNIRKPSTSPHFQLSSSGALTIGGSLTQNSDRNIKDNIEVISDSLNKVSLLNGSTYTRTDEGQDPTKVHAGLIAQDVDLALPEAVGETEDGIKTVDYSAVVALLVESVKSLTTEVNNLKQEIIELKNL